MIIPIRCFTCNNVIANKYIKYYKLKKKYSEKNNDQLDIIDLNNPDKSQVKIFKKIGIRRYCCKRMLLGQKDLLHLV